MTTKGSMRSRIEARLVELREQARLLRETGTAGAELLLRQTEARIAELEALLPELAQTDWREEAWKRGGAK